MPDFQFDPITTALAEDIGEGDVTCHFFVDPQQRGHGRIVAREDSITAGVETAAEVFIRVDPTTTVTVLAPSGSRVIPGDPVLEIEGRVASILTAERVALNFLQRLSGVATMTRHYVDAAGGRSIILDTRKTTPCLRALEKKAVVAGGGTNHRFGLFDMVMVKDNHLAARNDPAAIQSAIARTMTERPGTRIELEADTLEQVRMFLEISGIDVILLDNMSLEEMREAVRLGNQMVKFEASGGVTLERIPEIAATGVDYISVGALTHSARAIDFSLELA
jgi:nicotinate-nucleotide pyrophosphorylase (carboxylating)